MLRILPLADDLILPQAKQEIYFFNRIRRLLPVATAAFRGFLPYSLRKDDRQHLNSGGVPFTASHAEEILMLLADGEPSL